MECCQLVKANSIDGAKKHSVAVNYTWAKNLLKTTHMEEGSVSFKNNKLVEKVFVELDKNILKATLKSKTEGFPDFQQDHQAYLRQLEKEENAKFKAKKDKQFEEEKTAKDNLKNKKVAIEKFYKDQEKVVPKTEIGGHNESLEDDFW